MALGLPIVVLAAATSCNVHLQSAAAALQGHDAAKAEAILNSLDASCSSGSSRFYELKGVASSLSGNLKAAESAFRSAASLNPKSARLLTDLGAVYLREKKPALALTALQKALALDPSEAIATQYLIGSYVQLRKWRDASRLFDRLDPQGNPKLLDNPVMSLWFAQTLLGTKQLDRLHDFLASREQE
ncbi:MAG: tetratricopeptide repeat protein, partial [Candidatus Micrarchaeaceae archaeon]